MNSVCLVGNLGMDPELKYTQSGMAILRMRLATSGRKKVGGEWVEDTQWHTVKIFGARAESLGRFLGKGDCVGVRGRIQYDQWEDREGNKRTSTDIIADNVTLTGRGGGARQRRDPAQSPADTFGDDDIPF